MKLTDAKGDAAAGHLTLAARGNYRRGYGCDWTASLTLAGNQSYQAAITTGGRIEGGRSRLSNSMMPKEQTVNLLVAPPDATGWVGFAARNISRLTSSPANPTWKATRRFPCSIIRSSSRHARSLHHLAEGRQMGGARRCLDQISRSQRQADRRLWQPRMHRP